MILLYSFDECYKTNHSKTHLFDKMYYLFDNLAESENSNTHGNPTVGLIKAISSENSCPVTFHWIIHLNITQAI